MKIGILQCYLDLYVAYTNKIPLNDIISESDSAA